MNMGTKYTHRVTLRLNDEQYNFLIGISEMMDVKPSDFMRMYLNSAMVAAKKSTLENVTDALNGEVGTNENVKADCNNKL